MYKIDKNKLLINDSIEIILPDTIIEAVNYKEFIVLSIDYHFDKKNQNYNYEGGNVFCFDIKGLLKWQWKSKGGTRVWVEKDGLHVYDTSSLGYDCLVNVETGDIIKLKPVK